MYVLSYCNVVASAFWPVLARLACLPVGQNTQSILLYSEASRADEQAKEACYASETAKRAEEKLSRCERELVAVYDRADEAERESVELGEKLRRAEDEALEKARASTAAVTEPPMEL